MLKIMCAVCCMCLLLTGCLSPVTTPQKNNYILNSTPNLSPVSHSTSKVLLITLPRLDAVMNNNHMVYLDEKHQIGYFSENRWAAKPNDMLFSLLLTTLQQQGYFHAVVTAPYSGQSDLRLDIVNFSIVQDFTMKPSRVVVKMDARLVNVKQQTVIQARTITATIATTTADTPAAGVVAANQAVANCLAEIASFVNG
jgi:ABC-type uncharacterized transport system auxiliary subunit